jgi:hypothetical protein
VQTLAFSQDDRLLATAGSDSILALWNLTGAVKLHAFFQTHMSRLWSLAFSPDGKTIAAVAASGRLKTWRATNLGPDVLLLPGNTPDESTPSKRVRSLAFTADGKVLTAVNSSGIVCQLDPEQPAAQIGSWKLPTKGAWQALCSPIGRRLAFSDDTGLSLWDLQTGTQLAVLAKGPGHVPCSFTADEATAATVDPTQKICLWNTASRQLFKAFALPDGFLNPLLLPQGDLVVASDGGERAYCLCDVGTGREILRREVERGVVRALSARGTLMATINHDYSLDIWETRTWLKQPASPNGLNRGSSACAFSHDDRTLAVAYGTRVKLWDVATGQETLTLEEPGLECQELVFSPDNRVLACGGIAQDGQAVVWLWRGDRGHGEN